MASVAGRPFFSRMRKGKQPSRRIRLIRLLLIVLTGGFIAGPVISITFSLIGSGHLPALRSIESLARFLVIYGGLGALMSTSFFVTCGVPAIYFYPALQRYPRGIYLPLMIFVAFVGGLLGLALPSYLVLWLFGIRIIGEEQLRVVLAVDGAVGAALALVVAAFEKLRAEVKRTERLLYESKLNEQMLAERHANAKLKALQAQINPHFLFNTLSSIATLVSVDAASSKEMIISLAEIYRHILQCSNRKLVPLEEEFEMLRRYLNIEGVRFRDRLKVEIDAPEHLGQVMLPGLVLQPIVENAIKHGIARNLNDGCVSVRLAQTETGVTISVCNTSQTFLDLSRDKVFIEGHALKNVTDRLNAVYGDAYEFNIAYDSGKVCASLSIPFAVKAAHD